MWEKNRKEMMQILVTQLLYSSFEVQLKLVRNNQYQIFEKSALKKQNKDEINERFYEQTEFAFNEALINFKKQGAALILEGSGWAEHVTAYEQELGI